MSGEVLPQPGSVLPMGQTVGFARLRADSTIISILGMKKGREIATLYRMDLGEGLRLGRRGRDSSLD